MSSRIIFQNNTPGISLLTKNVTKLLHLPGVDCSPFPRTFMWNPRNGEKSYATAKNLLISPIRKIPLNRFKSFAVKSFISSPSNSNFQVIILCNLHLSFLLYHILNFRLYVHTCHAKHDKSIEWLKLSQAKFPFPPSNAIRKLCFYYCLFSSFSHSLFYFKLYKISTDCTPIGNL